MLGMESAAGEHVLLPVSISTPIVVVFALAALAAWLAAHFLVRRPEPRAGRVAFFVIRAAIGSGAVWLLLNVMARFLVLETSWRLWICAVATGTCLELITTLYRLERRTLPRRTGLILGGLRILLALLVALMLAEPIFAWRVPRMEERFVAVLVDDSASMDLSDPHASASEKMALAEVFLPDPPRRSFRVDQARTALRKARRQLGAEARWLELVQESDSATMRGQVERRRKKLAAKLREVAAVAERLSKELAAFVARTKPESGVAARLARLETKLQQNVRDPVDKAAAAGAGLGVEKLAAQCAEIRKQLAGAQAALGEVSSQLAALESEVDEAWFRSLTKEVREAVDKVAAQSRRAIARELLLKTAPGKPALLDVLGRKYTVRLYRFAAEPKEMSVGAWRAGDVPSEAAGARRATDLAGALEKVRADIPAGKLAGVLILTDGRHNAKRPVEPAGRWMGAQGVPVCVVLVGSLRPPLDAAVSGHTTPRTVQAGDRLVVRADIKLDGLKGKEAEVTLMLGGKVVDKKTVRAAGDAARATVELTDSPKEAGLREYVVKVAVQEGERIRTNNTLSVHVHVTDDPIKLLLIETRPRWEFRYIRNLFAGRDKSVKLQHVLFHPDWIDGASPRARVHASVTRGPGEVEASALPETEKDWLLFDVIILGDVAPGLIGPKEAKILEKFVGRRSGRLIVIAGPNYMPHAFAGSPLRDMLPVTFEPSERAVLVGPEVGFLLALSPAGERHVVTELDKDPDVNRGIWRGLPDIYWRHPIKNTKPGATVLAFAMPYSTPGIFKREPADAREAEQLARERDEFMRRRALIAVHRYGRGRVMMLTFDSTWRFRYRKGDVYHHKFWGQVLRWATADKLPNGNEFARLGTDRVVYAPDEPVRVRARLQDKDHTPVISDGVSVNVYRGETLVLHKKLDHIADSGGMYEADLGKLAPGESYEVVLEVKDRAQPELVGHAKGVKARIVIGAGGSAELAELTADRTIPDKLAQWTNGKAAGPEGASELPGRFGAGTHEVAKEGRYFLWRSWVLFLTIVCLASAEWIIRKKVGLA